MNEELAALAASGATALVAAMGTDLWDEAKTLMSGVIAHARRSHRRELSAALDQASTATRGAVDAGIQDNAGLDDGGLETAGLGNGRLETAGLDYWTDVLSQLLARNPALAPDVRALALLRSRGKVRSPGEVDSPGEAGRTGGAESPGVSIQVNSATHSGEVFAVQNGSQHFASGPRSRDPE